MTPQQMRARMATIDLELTRIRHGELGWDASVLARRDGLETERRKLDRRLSDMGEDPPRRSNGWGER